MSQKFIKSQNKNSHSSAYGKYYAQAVYDNHFVGTEELADFIQQQASVRKSDVKAVLQELGEALKHFFEMGQKVKLDGIGIFKIGFSSIGVTNIEDCGASTITTRRVLFQPETSRLVVGQEKRVNGSVKQKYVNAISLLQDVVFEEAHSNTLTPNESLTPNPNDGNLTPNPSPNGEGSENSGSNSGNTGGNDNGGGGNDAGENGSGD